MLATDLIADEDIVNKATIVTGHEIESDETTVYSGGRQFIKVDSMTEDGLDDAKFYVMDGSKVLYVNKAGKYVWFDKVTDLKLEGDELAPAEHKVGDDIFKLKSLESKNGGAFEIHGLDYGVAKTDSKTFTLMEYATPDDSYILPKEGFDFEVYHGSYKKLDEKPIANKSKGSLPSTGGVGTIVFYMVGAAAMAGVFLVARRKKTA